MEGMRKSRAQAAETRSLILLTATKMFLNKGLKTEPGRVTTSGVVNDSSH